MATDGRVLWGNCDCARWLRAQVNLAAGSLEDSFSGV